MLTPEVVQASDYFITMGCGDACPIFPGKKYLDWALDDPAGKGVEAVRPIRDEINTRIQALIAEIDAAHDPRDAAGQRHEQQQGRRRHKRDDRAQHDRVQDGDGFHAAQGGRPYGVIVPLFPDGGHEHEHGRAEQEAEGQA
ncbi:hypothetical protein AB0C14_04540 [Microbispora hainanensis]|uniref:hypothetical protein n=1 Tax=Microbispora hainanensis TaxID=568844 RepID=UPI0033E55BE2